MPEVKRIICDYWETAKTVYSIVRREADNYRLNDADGSFASSPTDPYLSLTEDGVIKGRYEVSESRAVWNDGSYTTAIYKQITTSSVPASDNIIGTGIMYIKNDLEITDNTILVAVSGATAGVWTEPIASRVVFASGLSPILVAVSGLKNDVSGLPGILTAISGIQFAVTSGLDNILTAVSGVPFGVWSEPFANRIVGTSGLSPILIAVSGLKNDVSGLPATLVAISSVPSGIWIEPFVSRVVATSGLNSVLTAVSGLKTDVSAIPGVLTAVSGIPSGVWNESFASKIVGTSGLNEVLVAVSGLKTNMSAIPGVLTAISGVPIGVRDINTADATSLTSGTIGHDSRLGRWFGWENWTIDKRYTPNRLYMKTDDTNYSSYFALSDDANLTTKARSG